MRRMGVVVGMAMLSSLFGCGGSAGSDGSDGSGSDASKRADTTRAAAREAFPAVGEAVEAASFSGSGGGRWAICGMQPSPSGAEYVAEIAITQTNTGSSEHPDGIESALTSTGWTVDNRTGEVVEASKDGLTFRARYGSGGINLSIRSGCVDASKDVVAKLTDEPADNLGVAPPS
ncbi:hypothetical protein GEV29_02590 [Aeromicrobium sp. SMF47]|uniref:hypothetical protein n=1 Tax=Aeromicrobium yanjiei TaxID=2662028 RepID=UPI00129E9053|nr:hypothetical protein [Aeromicrobium yanjiei]MRJ75414.1 hypothetical protein [Aeromicrobium yanjiei]